MAHVDIPFNYRDPRSYAWIEMFFATSNALGIFSSTVSGTGAAVGTAVFDGAGGINITSGTATTGIAQINTSPNQFNKHSGVWFYQRLQLNAGFTTTGFRLITGMANSFSAGEPATGLYFEIEPAGNGYFWTAVAATNSVRTKTITSVAVTNTTNYTIRIELNAAGDSCAYYINDALVATHTTNLPDRGSGSRAWGIGTRVENLSTTTSRIIYTDVITYVVRLVSRR